MNVSDYQAAGYYLGNVQQAAVTRAETEIIAAYIVPLVGHMPTQDERDAEPLKTAIMSLSFLLIQQRSAVATRAGAKVKMTSQSNTPTAEDVLRQNAPACVRALCAVNPSKNPVKECSDICGVFFRTNHFYTH